jgi:ATP-dependent helicase/nuclease subunit A
MTEETPNPEQQRLITNLDGIYKVDAGAGTGKTFSITRRYANLLESRPVEPEDVLLITFTRNAASEMKDRIIDHTDYQLSALRDAPINTFHGVANQLLSRHGFQVPERLGIDDHYSSSTTIIDDAVVERDRFREFLLDFSDSHPEYDEFLRILNDPTSLLSLINQLASKGIFPMRDGWYRDGEAHLDGDFADFKDLFEAANEPNEGVHGPNQSDLRSKLGGFGHDSCFLPNAPAAHELRGDGKQVNPRFAEEAFDEDREQLKAFVHDVYFGYIEFALSRNFTTFGFLQMFAYVLLMEDSSLREELEFEYVMIDEFQDTSEIQFKLALLLAGKPNLCVVGDWKQSIFSFQYAEVANIQDFSARLQRFATELNRGEQRVDFDIEVEEPISLKKNYRSTQDVIGFSEHALTLEATKKEELDGTGIREEITTLESATSYSTTQLEAFTAEDEYEGILHKIQHIVENEEYQVKDEETGEMRSPKYGDITILTRTRDFGREFQDRADEYGLPVAYEGEVELLKTDQALLVLAWLRILENPHSDRGWAVVLERAGYTVTEVAHLLEEQKYPDEMLTFREELSLFKSVEAIARKVLDRYAFDDAYADAIIELLDRIVSQTTLNRGEVIHFLEEGIKSNVTYSVDDSPGQNSVTVQTIHSTKGLEHSIVIVANINQAKFPSTSGSRDRIKYDDPVGLRQSKVYAEAHGKPHVYDNWKYTILRKCLSGEYDEERRLMYVAMSRAKHHLLFSAGEKPSAFFENLPLDPVEIDPAVQEFPPTETVQTKLQVSMPKIDAPEEYSAHDLMDDSVFDEDSRAAGRGTAYGQEVHEFAEAYAEGKPVEPDDADEENVAAFIDTLSGKLDTEVNAYLPVKQNGKEVTISGIIDLLHVREDRVEIVDFKTDRDRSAEAEYRKQLSIYYHVVKEVYPDRDVEITLFYTQAGEQVPLDSLEKANILVS